jgi:hypothetical protein
MFTISGNVSGQVAVGENIHQAQSLQAGPSRLTEAELKSLSELIESLRAQVESEAPPEKKAPALERVSELEQAITAKEPDVSTMEYVKNWFVKNIPQLAGTVTSVVINPIVGKLVEAAGETVVNEFKRRFGA